MMFTRLEFYSPEQKCLGLFYYPEIVGWSMKMPDKDPNVWLVISAYIQQNYNAITGFVMAFLCLCSGRGFYNKKHLSPAIS